MIIERYLYREVGQTFFGVFGVLLLIFVSQRFARYLASAAAGDFSAGLLLEVLASKVIANLVVILPLSFFLAVLLSFGRLYSDSEMTALGAAGVSLRRLTGATALLSLGVAAGGLVLALVIGPRASAVGERLEGQARESADVTGIAGGRFKVIAGGTRVFYAREITSDRQGMTEVFAHLRDRPRPLLVVADRGYQMTDPASGDRFLVMVDGHLYEGRAGERDIAVTRFREYAVRIRESLVDPGAPGIAEMPTGALLRTPGAAARAELHWRLAMPLATALLGPLGMLLARTGPRQGPYVRLLYGILVYVVYTNVLGILRELVERERLAPEIGLWPAHLAVGLLILALYRRQASPRLGPRRRSLTGAGGRA